MRILVLVASAILMSLSSATCLAQASRTKLPAQQFQITDCSTTVQANVEGATYTVMNELSFGPNDCIDVTASGITINLNGNELRGGCSCSGISVSKSAIGVHILGPGTIGGVLDYAIHDMGNLAVIESLTTTAQSFSGIFLDTVQGSIVKEVTVGGSLGTNDGTSGGIQLTDTNHCVVERSMANGNGLPFTCAAGEPCIGSSTTGIFVGNSGSQNLSIDNLIVGNQANYNVTEGISVGGTGNVVTGNTAAQNNNGDILPPVGVGIGVGGPGSNLVIDNTAFKNQTEDLYDGNPHCGTDHWAVNTFTTSNQTCIH
jgi:hypothetical protein